MISPTIILTSAALAAGIAVGATGAWTWQGRNIDALKLEAKDERIARDRANRTTIDRLTTKVITAQNNAATRAPVLRRGADAAANAGNGLRVTSDTAVRSAADNPDACRSIVNAYAEIQRESSDFIREVSIVADQCISDVQTLTEAYPK